MSYCCKMPSSDGLLEPASESVYTLMCNLFVPLLRRNMPAHTAPVDKLYEALIQGTSGMQQAFGVPNGFHLFARPEVGRFSQHHTFPYISAPRHMPLCIALHNVCLRCATSSCISILVSSCQVRARPSEQSTHPSIGGASPVVAAHGGAQALQPLHEHLKV
jgi:hypothetical protein